MEDVPSATNHTGQLGPPGGPMGINAKMSQEEPAQRPQYSIPGILHFIQHEWARFEMERAQWDVERAEFQVSVTLACLVRVGNTPWCAAAGVLSSLRSPLVPSPKKRPVSPAVDSGCGRRQALPNGAYSYKPNLCLWQWLALA
ncbi:hypothetical protein HPB48_012911 [Haemaphysalis longicornis]|uniref:Striatin N-terminal domain-containing protein n=1 Tax=Haemaphysalis longicornis TaxID=44386 RepID=A0A9J6GHP8_HAELO|nr:hypothetical protein HPB48_012911 [Haemaphysalis longicornis]